MAVYQIKPERTTLHGHFSRDLPPVLTIESGDTVVFQTLEAGWATERPRSPREWNESFPRFQPRVAGKDDGHALCGPVAVRGAKPGMTLEVRIEEIVPGAWGWTRAGGWPHEVNDRLGLTQSPTTLLWEINNERKQARDTKGWVVSIHPFLGVMGMPPDAPGILSTAPPRATGGNLDCKELVAGSTLFLPIAVEGGLFSTGDGHAAQGDGEVSVTAIECPMERAQLTFHLHETMQIKTPRAHTTEGWLTFGVHEDLNEAMFVALDAMLDLMCEQFTSISRSEALALASVVVDLRVTQIVNGSKGVHAVLPHNAIQGL